MNKRIRKKKQKQQQAMKPDLQTAWNVVAEYLNKDGQVCYFVDRPSMLTTTYELREVNWEIHSADRGTIITSTLKEKK